MKEIKELIEISRYYGNQKDYTLAGGGNTSFKNNEYIWVKTSGSSLADITEDDFALLDREKVKLIGIKNYSTETHEREKQVKGDLIECNVDKNNIKRPSVETSLHELINYAFIVHLHPTITNALTCSKKAEKITEELFGKEVMFIRYAVGYHLYKITQANIEDYRKNFGKDPKIIFLQNHGVFVGADNISEIKEIYKYITETISNNLTTILNNDELPVKNDAKYFLPAIRMMLSENSVKVLKIRHNALSSHFYQNKETFRKAALPFTPDTIVYCKGKYMYINESSSPEKIIDTFKKQLPVFIKENGYVPQIIMIRDYGILAAGENAHAASTCLDVYEDLLKISYHSESFGGPHFLGKEEIAFIDNWEVEEFRRKISGGELSKSVVDQKIVIVTGGAQGFGVGIAENLVNDNANVIIADINEEAGLEATGKLTKLARKNQVHFVKTDVTSPGSVSNLIFETVRTFGGIDTVISNAGILRAGGLNEMDPETFQAVTKVNYEGYFLLAKYASEILIIQSKYRSDYLTDIIQINSKSGLKGSNRNFAYAGSKFGGIGLTQSFALELAPYNIKVNSICPGNFFEGPLWSDPENGLFVQYLKAGKVREAKTIEDVKKFYEELIPMGRGCRVEDLMKAIYYAIAQEYETGQAIPVTGGQVMLR